MPLRASNALDSPDSTSSTHMSMPMPLMNSPYVIVDLRLHRSLMKKGGIDGVDPTKPFSRSMASEESTRLSNAPI